MSLIHVFRKNLYFTVSLKIRRKPLVIYGHFLLETKYSSYNTYWRSTVDYNLDSNKNTNNNRWPGQRWTYWRSTEDYNLDSNKITNNNRWPGQRWTYCLSTVDYNLVSNKSTNNNIWPGQGWTYWRSTVDYNLDSNKKHEQQ